MQPALNPSVGSEDYVFLSKWSVNEMGVERGDIISLISPKDPSQKLIKRVVGLEGKYNVILIQMTGFIMNIIIVHQVT